jgi:hypothetical protein
MTVNYSLVMTIASAVSVFSSFTIFFSFGIFPSLRSKPYMRLVFYIALSDMLSGLGSCMGLPASGTAACWFEGVATNIFTLSSVMWTVVISLMMYSIVVYGKVLELNYKYHLVCWGFPVFITFIPLATHVTYGSPDGSWCWLVSTAKTPWWAMTFWQWANFYAIVWGGVFVMLVIFVALLYELKTNVHVATKQVVVKVFNKLQLYPFVLIMAWLVPCVHDTYVSVHPNLKANDSVALETISLLLPCLQGFFTSFVFWLSNGDVRRSLLRYVLYNNPNYSLNSMFSKASAYSSRGPHDCGDDSNSEGKMNLYTASKKAVSVMLNVPVIVSNKIMGTSGHGSRPSSGRPSSRPASQASNADDDGNTVVSNVSKLKPGFSSSSDKVVDEANRRYVGRQISSGSNRSSKSESCSPIPTNRGRDSSRDRSRQSSSPQVEIMSPGTFQLLTGSESLTAPDLIPLSVSGGNDAQSAVVNEEYLQSVARELLNMSSDDQHRLNLSYEGDVEAGLSNSHSSQIKSFKMLPPSGRSSNDDTKQQEESDNNQPTGPLTKLGSLKLVPKSEAATSSRGKPSAHKSNKVAPDPLPPVKGPVLHHVGLSTTPTAANTTMSVSRSGSDKVGASGDSGEHIISTRHIDDELDIEFASNRNNDNFSRLASGYQFYG